MHAHTHTQLPRIDMTKCTITVGGVRRGEAAEQFAYKTRVTEKIFVYQNGETLT